MNPVLTLYNSRLGCKHEFTGYGGHFPILRIQKQGVVNEVGRETLLISALCQRCDTIVDIGSVKKPKEFNTQPFKNAINDLLETADDEGCTPDLVVVEAAALRALAELGIVPI